MDMSKENETTLLSQGGLGCPRDRHGGAPDAAGSTVHGRESCEGTTGVGLDSASVAQAATVDLVPNQIPRLEISLERLDPIGDRESEKGESGGKAPGTKRKAKVSPGALSFSEENSDQEDHEKKRKSVRIRKEEIRKKRACQGRQPEMISPEEGIEVENKGSKGKAARDDEMGEEGIKGKEEVLEVSGSDSERQILAQQNNSGREGLRRRKRTVMIISSEEEEERVTSENKEARGKKKKEPVIRDDTVKRGIEKVKGKKGKDSRIENVDSIDITSEAGKEEEGTEDRECRTYGGKEKTIKGQRKEEKSEVEFAGMTTQEIRDYVIMCLEDAETVRIKTKAMQGGLSGILKDRILGLRGAIECLVEKLEEKGDTIYYKTKNNELIAENKRLKKECERVEREKGVQDQEIEVYRSMYEEAENKYVEAEKRIFKMKRGSDYRNEEEDVEVGKERISRDKERIYGQKERNQKMRMDLEEEPGSRMMQLGEEKCPAFRPVLRTATKFF